MKVNVSHCKYTQVVAKKIRQLLAMTCCCQYLSTFSNTVCKSLYVIAWDSIWSKLNNNPSKLGETRARADGFNFRCRLAAWYFCVLSATQVLSTLGGGGGGGSAISKDCYFLEGFNFWSVTLEVSYRTCRRQPEVECSVSWFVLASHQRHEVSRFGLPLWKRWSQTARKVTCSTTSCRPLLTDVSA